MNNVNINNIDQLLTFTRARTHKKNDQAFVEEKNGSVVRRLVGYNRYQGTKAWEALANFYHVLRQYINFFQPSLKLQKKTRKGGKVYKQYHRALTPYQRLIKTGLLSTKKIAELESEYIALDPVKLMADLKRLQQQLNQFSWHLNAATSSIPTDSCSTKTVKEPTSLDINPTIGTSL